MDARDPDDRSTDWLMPEATYDEHPPSDGSQMRRRRTAFAQRIGMLTAGVVAGAAVVLAIGTVTNDDPAQLATTASGQTALGQQGQDQLGQGVQPGEGVPPLGQPPAGFDARGELDGEQHVQER
jgi:hypothetical protein